MRRVNSPCCNVTLFKPIHYYPITLLSYYPIPLFPYYPITLLSIVNPIHSNPGTQPLSRHREFRTPTLTLTLTPTLTPNP